MTKNVSMLVAVFALMAGAVARTQEKPAQTAAKVVTPLKVQIVLSRYQGEKKTTNLPYTLWVNANDANRTSLRMGAQVPIVSTSYTAAQSGGASVNPLKSFNYKDVGTLIDCSARTLDDGRFRLELSIEDSSVYDDQPSVKSATRASDQPAFRSFRSTNTLILRDGQSVQYTTATDKISGEVVKIDVTINVIK